MAELVIEKLLTVDETGTPKAPTLRQIQDKDVALLWQRDTTSDKRKYIREVGVIYYLGDPKSPARSQGLNDIESLKLAIENYNLPADYQPDNLVKKLIDKYYKNCITEAGVAIENLHKAIHISAVVAKKISEILSRKLTDAISDEDMTDIFSKMDVINKRIIELPAMTKALATAYDNLRNEEEQQQARGGKQILSSMDADEGI